MRSPPMWRNPKPRQQPDAANPIQALPAVTTAGGAVVCARTLRKSGVGRSKNAAGCVRALAGARTGTKLAPFHGSGSLRQGSQLLSQPAYFSPGAQDTLVRRRWVIA